MYFGSISAMARKRIIERASTRSEGLKAQQGARSVYLPTCRDQSSDLAPSPRVGSNSPPVHASTSILIAKWAMKTVRRCLIPRSLRRFGLEPSSSSMTVG